MASQKVLLPYNFTNGDHKALDFVTQMFGHVEDVEITLFHAYTPVPNIEITRGTVMEKMRGSLGYLSQRISEQEVALKAAKNNLLENGFSEDQIRYIFRPRNKNIAGEVIDVARNGHYDVIIVNHKAGKATRLFTECVYKKVADVLKDTAVCVVT